MGILDTIKGIISPTRSIVEIKEPEVSVAQVVGWQDYASKITGDGNYLDQYVGWQYRAIKTKTDSLISYPIPFYKKDSDGWTEVGMEDPVASRLLKDLYRFNGDVHFREARIITRMHIDLAGVSAWHITTSEEKGFMYEFYILNPTKLAARLDKFGRVDHYDYTEPDGTVKRLEKKSVIIFREPNPKNYLEGYSPLRAGKMSHNTYEFMQKFNLNFFGNMARPEGLLSIEGIKDEDRRRLEKKLKTEYGGVKNAGKIAIINRKVEWTELTKSQKDLQYAEGIKLMREDILAFQGVPKPLVGLTDSTYANSAEAQRVYQRYTVKPMLELEEAIFNEELLTKYFTTPGINQQYRFQAVDPVELDKDSLTTNVTKTYTSGLITKNEAREELGYEPADDDTGDSYYRQPSSTTTPPQPTNDSGDENQDPNKALKQIKTLREFDTEELKQYFFVKAINQESQFSQVASKWFDEQAQRVINSARPMKSIDVTFDINWEDENDKGKKFFEEIYFYIAGQALEDAINLTGENWEMTEKAKQQLLDELEYFVGEINKTTRSELFKVISDAIETGSSTDVLIEKISELFNSFAFTDGGMPGYRAERIARTEVGKVRNLIMQEMYDDSDFVKGYKWLTAHDEQVRSAHAIADGQARRKGQKFDVGGETLARPGDPAGSPANIINCRCVLIPVWDESELPE